MADEGSSYREALLRYYGANPAAAAASRTSSTPKSSDIDALNFDADAHVENLLRKRNLDQLIRTHRMLHNETRKLDSGMKTLVYENYNKFISATDTIRQMKTNVVNMEEEMGRLGDNIECHQLTQTKQKITESSEKVSYQLADNRSSIERLSAVSRLLKKRQFLFELPSRLEKCIDLKAYSTAVKYYAGTRGILEKYSHLPSLAQIHTDCAAIISRLKLVLEEKAADPNASVRELIETVGLLLDLDQPAEELQKRYLSIRVGKLKQSLIAASRASLPEVPEKAVPKEDFSVEETTMNGGTNDNEDRSRSDGREAVEAEGEKENDGDALHEQRMLMYLDQLNDKFLGTFLEFVASYNDLFVVRENVPAASKRARARLNQEIQPLLTSYCECVTERVMDLSRTEGIIRCLSFINMALEGFARNSPPIDVTNITAITLKDDAVKVVKKNLSDLFRSAAEQLRRRTQKEHDHREDTTLHAFHDEFKDKATAIVMNNFVDRLKPLFDCQKAPVRFLAEHTPVFRDSMRSGLADIFSYVNDISNRYRCLCCGEDDDQKRDGNNKDREETSGDESDAPPPILLLFLAKTLLYVEESFLPTLFGRLKEIAQLVPYNAPGARDLKLMDENEFSSELKSTSMSLLSSYVQVQGVSLSLMIRRGVETSDWLSGKVKEPRGVKGVVLLIIEEICNRQKELEDLLDVAHEARRAGSRLPRNRSVPQQERLMKRNISKLFGEKMEIFGGKIEFSPASIVEGIIKIFLKSFAECVRMRTFGKFGYQQVQVDATFLGRALRDLVENSQILDSMLDEVIASAADRCIDPTPMEKTIVRAICDKQHEENSR